MSQLLTPRLCCLFLGTARSRVLRPQALRGSTSSCEAESAICYAILLRPDVGGIAAWNALTETRVRVPEYEDEGLDQILKLFVRLKSE